MRRRLRAEEGRIWEETEASGPQFRVKPHRQSSRLGEDRVDGLPLSWQKGFAIRAASVPSEHRWCHNAISISIFHIYSCGRAVLQSSPFKSSPRPQQQRLFLCVHNISQLSRSPPRPMTEAASGGLCVTPCHVSHKPVSSNADTPHAWNDVMHSRQLRAAKLSHSSQQ